MRVLMTALSVLAGMVGGEARAERASDGQLNIYYWQAVSIMNPYLSSGIKDLQGASLVLEPLARYGPDGQLVPFLAESIPTLENGGVSADLMSVTWRLREGLLWSDGTPATAEDAVFTWEYCTDPKGGCAQALNFLDVASVEAVDDLTVRVNFDVPKPYPYGPLVGAQAPLIQKAQFSACLGVKARACAAANSAPVGTGPFVVTEFRANDRVRFAANEYYREPDKPAFATALLKGGGDALEAARAVLQTGEFDYAWNVQVAPELIAEIMSSNKGETISAFGTLVEWIMVNQADPDAGLGEARSTRAHPHPFLTDPAVTRALSLAIDREILAETGYGAAGRVSCNLIAAPDYNRSPNNGWCEAQDLKEANRLLDEAGWVLGEDGVRAKEGRRLSLVYQTSTNAVRQSAQALVRQWWAEIGVEAELRDIDAGVFFGGDPDSPNTFQKFYADVQQYAQQFDGIDPEKYLGDWRCDAIPSPQTQWQGNNTARFCSPEYDELHALLAETSGREARSEIIIRLNDLIVNSAAFIPLVHRGRVSAKSATLGGVEMNAWDSQLWNAADWFRKD